jgi:hypothetical protein
MVLMPAFDLSSIWLRLHSMCAVYIWRTIRAVQLQKNVDDDSSGFPKFLSSDSYQLGLAKRAAPLSPTDVYVYSNGEMGIDSKRRERKKVSCFNISPDGATILIFICTPMSQKEPPAHSPLWPFFVTFFFGFLLYITFQSR